MKFLKILYPERCPLCDLPFTKGTSGFCNDCLNKLYYVEGLRCIKCGKRVSGKDTFCYECKGAKHYYDAGSFAVPYECVRESIYRFKYQNRPGYKTAYTKLMLRETRDFLESVEIDGIVPVPVHKKRFLKRGYNQADLLAKELSKALKIPCYSNYTKRIINTLPQKLFDRKRRQINVKNSFIVPANSVKLSNVLLIDDIYTTGSTIDSLAKVLKESGVNKVYFLTLSAAGS